MRSRRAGPWSGRLTAALLLLSSGITLSYTAASIYIATVLAFSPLKPLQHTPAQFGLQYRDVSFPSREDHLSLKGWLIPGVLPGGHLTTARTIIVMHGRGQNRTDPDFHLLDLDAALVRSGFAVLAFDLRGMGQSFPAPQSFGYFERRDVGGAVDFLRSGPVPYPELGRPRIIGGFGVSYGAASLILGASEEPALAAVVSDSAYADVMPLLEREIQREGHIPALFAPGALLAGRVIYGIDYPAVRPVDAIRRVSPRPILLIHGQADFYIPITNSEMLYAAASATPGAQVTFWRVAGASHAHSFRTWPDEYGRRVVAFFDRALGVA